MTESEKQLIHCVRIRESRGRKWLLVLASIFFAQPPINQVITLCWRKNNMTNSNSPTVVICFCGLLECCLQWWYYENWCTGQTAGQLHNWVYGVIITALQCVQLRKVHWCFRSSLCPATDPSYCATNGIQLSCSTLAMICEWAPARPLLLWMTTNDEKKTRWIDRRCFLI